MQQNRFRSFWLPIFLVPIGGLMALALTLVLYGAIYLLLEGQFYPNNPQDFPAGTLRMVCAILLAVLYLLLLRTRLWELLKAILLPGPLAGVVISVGHALYERPAVSVAAMIAVVAICGWLLYRFKKPWFYAYALAIGAIVSLAYAWPEPWR